MVVVLQLTRFVPIVRPVSERKWRTGMGNSVGIKLGWLDRQSKESIPPCRRLHILHIVKFLNSRKKVFFKHFSERPKAASTFIFLHKKFSANGLTGWMDGGLMG